MPRRSGPRLADEVALADELVERARAHPGGERLPLGRWLEQGFGAGPAGSSGGRHGPTMVRAGRGPRQCVRGDRSR